MLRICMISVDMKVFYSVSLAILKVTASDMLLRTSKEGVEMFFQADINEIFETNSASRDLLVTARTFDL